MYNEALYYVSGDFQVHAIFVFRVRTVWNPEQVYPARGDYLGDNSRDDQDDPPEYILAAAARFSEYAGMSLAEFLNKIQIDPAD